MHFVLRLSWLIPRFAFDLDTRRLSAPSTHICDRFHVEGQLLHRRESGIISGFVSACAPVWADDI